MGFKPVADNGALRSLKDLPSETEDDPPHEHKPEGVIKAAHAEDELPQHAEHASDDEDNSGSDTVD